MGRSIAIALGGLIALGALGATGCSSQSATETPQVEGKTPAEYRDEMEKKSGQVGDAKAPKSKGKARSRRD